MTSVVENLRRQINHLREITEQTDISPSDADAIKETVENIRDCCQQFSETERGYVAEILFNDNANSLLTILNDCVQKQQFADAIGISVEAFTSVIWKLDVKHIERYCVSIWNFAFKVCRNENLKSARESGFELLVAIMDQLKTSEKRDTFDVGDLVRWCWQQLGKLNKLTSSVKKGLFQLVGALCKFYPALLRDNDSKKNYSSTFALVMATELKSQISSSTKAPVYTIIEGCLTGLSGLLCNFSDAFEGASNRLTTRELYNCAKIATNPATKTTRLGPRRAALELLTTHASLFKSFFYEEYRLLYDYFRDLALHSNRELRYAGLNATEVLLKQVSLELLERCKANPQEAKNVYKFFVDEFSRSIRRARSTREVAMCAKGHGQFAAACKALFGPEHLQKTLVDLTSRCEEVFMLSSDPLEQKVTYIPTFLEAFSMVFAAIDEVPPDVWLPVETLHILLFQHFPLLDPKYHQRCVNVSYQLFRSVFPFNDRYTENIVYQSIARVCSLTPQPLVSDEEEEENENTTRFVTTDRDPRNFTYRDYLPLWRELISGASVKGFEQFGFDVNVKNLISKNIADSFFKALIEMLDRLDFVTVSQSTNGKDGEAEDARVSSDPVADVAPRKTTDLCLLVNMADFTRDLITSIYVKAFSDWFFPLSSRLVDLSTRYPLISGFYKLLTLCLNVGNKMKLVEVDAISGALGAFQLFSNFIDEVSVRMKQFKDDLLVSCLELVLAIPTSMVIKKVDVLTNVIKSGLELGASYLPLAEACLNALERWNANGAYMDALLPLYSSILPSFDEYLRNEGVEDEPANSTMVSTSKRSRKRGVTKKDASKDKTRMKAASAKKTAQMTRLNDLRRRIVIFVGKLGGEVNKHLIEQTAEEVAKKCVAWDSETKLEYNIPFMDMKPIIQFDHFLPRVCELAVWCGNRRTKVAACELLHSIVLLLLGKAAVKRNVNVTERGDGGQQRPENRTPFHKIYRRLFPVLLQLCCDADEVPKQLFRTLTTQTIHWFTSNKSSDNPETAALLEALMDGLVSQDATLRDYCAECLNEFLRWSIKHSSKDPSAINNNFRGLLKRLYSLASHPNNVKRLGAALAFNSIYRTFREHDGFVDLYTLEIFAVFMNSLARAHADDDNDGGAVTQLIAVTKHIDRIVKQTKTVLSQHNEKRKVPVGWSGATLKDCVVWLAQQLPRPRTFFRQRCFDLMLAWIPLLEGFGSLKHFLNKLVEDKGISLFEWFENGGVVSGFGGIRKLPELDEMDKATAENVISWLDSLEATLDCYLACLDQSIIVIDDLNVAVARGQCLLMRSIRCFLDKLSLADLDPLHFPIPLEHRRIARAKCRVTVRVLNFVAIILPKAKCLDTNLLDAFWRLLVRCCFNPSAVGFDMTSKETAEFLPKTLKFVLSTVKPLPADITVGFYSHLEEACKSIYALPSMEKLVEARQSNWLTFNEMLLGYEITMDASVLPAGYFPNGGELWRSTARVSFPLQSTGNATVRSWLPSALLAVRNVLKTAAKVTKEVDDVVSLLFDETPVTPYKGASRMTTKGKSWFSLFRAQISELIARNANSFLPSMMNSTSSPSNRILVAEILVKVTDYIARNRELRRRFGMGYVNLFAKECRKLLETLADGDEASQCLCIGLMQKISLIDTKFLSNAAYLSDIFVKLISSKKPDLSFKNKALLLLGPFAASLDKNGKLADALNTFVVNSFPFRSTEFTKGSKDYDEYLIALRRLVLGLRVSDSTVILDTLIKVLSREKEHSAEAEIAALLSAYCRSLSPAKYESIIIVPLNFFFCTDQRINDEHRLNCLSKFLLPMLGGFDDNMLSRFFIDKGLTLLMEKLEALFTRTNDNVERREMVTKMGCMRLLELMYDRLDISVLKGPINEKYIGKHSAEKTELIKKIAQLAKDARNVGKDETNSLKWSYRCAAHNLLIALVSKTQSQSKLYDGFIFKETWSLITDFSKSYLFNLELEDQPKRKQQLLNMQMAWRKRASGRTAEDGSQDVKAGSTLQFLSSQFLAESSLQSDVSEYDFTASSIGEALQKEGNEDSQRKMSQDTYNSSQDQSQIMTLTASEDSSSESCPVALDLEADELNLHPCMEPMLNIIKSLVDRNITPLEQGEMPMWMSTMLLEMERPSTHINTKFFIARIVTVLDDIFARFGNLWLAPLASLCLDSNFHENGLNYFRVDIIATSLRWAKASESQSVRLNSARNWKSDLFQYCLTHAPCNNGQMFRRNLRLLNLMMEVWKENIRVDASLIVDRMKMSEVEQPAKIGTGIQLLGVILANGMDPFDGGSRSGGADVYRTLGACLTAKSAKTYKPAAEVAGLLLKLVYQKDSAGADEICDHILAQIRYISGQDKAKFITCLHAIQRHYPQFSDSFLSTVLAYLPGVYGEFKVQCLEIIHARAEKISKLYSELKARNILNYLQSHDQRIQICVVKIVCKIVESLSLEELKEVTPEFCVLVTRASAECRRILAEFFIRVYDMKCSAETNKNDDPIVAMVKESLLVFLNDPEPPLRLLVFNFWTHETRLHTSTTGRVLDILKQTYSESTQREFLGHATYLLLELTSRSPDYKRSVFETPLQDCRFEDLHVLTSWKRRYASLQMPAFAESMLPSQQQVAQSPTKATLAVRATVLGTPQFSQTLAPGADGTTAFDWMTGATYDTFAGGTVSASVDTDESGLLFAPRKRDQWTGASRGTPKLPRVAGVGYTARPDADEDEKLLKQLKRRIVKDNGQTTAQMFARMQTRRQKAREKLEEERKKAREQNVQLYRSYRQGDFPDIQIPHSAVIAPLQALAQQDPSVASLLFTALLNGVYSEVQRGDEKESSEVALSLSHSIEEIMSSTGVCYKPLLTCLQVFCFRNVASITLHPNALCNASLLSHQQRMGVVLLERYMQYGEADAESGPKRRRVAAWTREQSENVDSGATISWINLAKLYKSLGDSDSVRAIFAYKLPSKEDTKHSLEAETSGDYSQAIDLYTKALKDNSFDENEMSDLDDAEYVMWEESRLNCLNLLNKWTDLASVTTKYIDDGTLPNFDKVWDDPYSQAVYLPYLMRAKLKLLCTADEKDGDRFMEFINDWLNSDEEKRRLLETNHVELLAVNAIAKREFAAADHFCKKALNKFLNNWSSLAVTDHAARQQCLQSVQILAEMDEFIKLAQKGGVESMMELESVLNRWEKRRPGLMTNDSTCWNDISTNRHLFTELLSRGLLGRRAPEEEVYQCVFRNELRTNLLAVRNALHMRNYALAFSLLDHAKQQLVGIVKDGGVVVEWVHAYVHAQHVVSARSFASPATSAPRLISAVTVLERYRAKSEETEYRAKHCLLEGLSRERLGWVCSETGQDNNWYESLDSKTQRALSEIGYDCRNPNAAYGILQSALPFYHGAVNSHSGRCYTDEHFQQIDAHLALAEYCDRVLRAVAESSRTMEIDYSSYPEMLTQHLLLSMKLGCKRARLLFPRLIEIVQDYPSVWEVFKSTTATVPCWMFLGWLSQITAVLNKPFAENFHGIIERVCDSYPEALVYCFGISTEGFDANAEFLKRITAKLDSIPGVKEFIRALLLFSPPDAEFRDIKSHFTNTSMPLSQRKAILEKLYRGLFMLDYSEEELGSFWMDFRKKYQPKIDQLLGYGFEKVLTEYNDSMRTQVVKLEMHLKSSYSFDRVPNNLASYSKWLSQYDAGRLGFQLEIPGQYDGEQMPTPENHVRIAGFSSHVVAFMSIRVPRKLTIRGNDGKEYDFLVKTGEDLRQDERIQRLFSQMNEMFAADADCRRMNAKIRTYNIVPLTTSLGLISFVPNSKTLKDFMNIDETSASKCVVGNGKAIRASTSRPQPNDYKKSYDDVPHKHAADFFINAEKCIPKTELRDKILRLCASPDGFYSLRSQFISSYCTSSVAGYVLGVGDRHLKNIMIDETSASVVAIDFGHAFGGGICIAIPELMPFRMTQQIRGVLEPVGMLGHPRAVMLSCLQSLREHRYILLNILNVFMNEPSIDWLKEAERRQAQSASSVSSEPAVNLEDAWMSFAPRRMQVADRKLRGDNPAAILETEWNNLPKTFCNRERVIEVIYGKRNGQPVAATDRERPRGYPAVGLNVEDQLTCLIEMATDPLILVRTWSGWSPWV